MVNQRTFFRLELEPPLEAQTSIVRIKDNEIESGEAHVLVDNISAGGLGFVSNLNLPVQTEIVLEFRMRLFNQQIKPLGYIVRKAERPDGLFHYGVSFTIDEDLKALLVRLVSELQIKLRRGNNITSCDFYHGDATAFFDREHQ
ncbi:PilZ domain-containing protein [Brevibacillus humidisoli]|uniref:PilZ domain-containing protein n=1 Tax=Brevibacillus humidisoli TaxID=2895522 RepID=UPI001E3895CF|nr:PilZ domain-containing protein [Brevibacillus humidisoli]UFJ43368.1 PilZ domain-containing protein [Brevibacillus humidisoli]